MKKRTAYHEERFHRKTYPSVMIKSHTETQLDHKSGEQYHSVNSCESNWSSQVGLVPIVESKGFQTPQHNWN